MLPAKSIVRPREPTKRGRITRGGFDLPPSVLRRGRERMRRMSVVMLPFAIALATGWLAMGMFGLVEWKNAWMIPAGCGLCLAILTLVVAASRSPKVTDLQALYIAIIAQVFFVGVAATVQWTHEWVRFQAVTPFGPYTIMVVLSPVLMPMPPRTVGVVSTAAVTTVPLTLYLVELFGWASPSPGNYLDVTSVAYGTVLLAYMTARVVYRLEVDVVDAKRMGSYQLETCLGEGGMGQVWKARHQMLARPAAIKLIHPDYLSPERAQARPQAIERFSREAQAIAALESPHTIRLFDFGVTDEGTFFYAMEYLDGIDLEQLIREDGAQPYQRAHAIAMQVCDSIADAHDAGVVHRDIKPGNVMICPRGRWYDFVKVLDFGLVGSPETPSQDSQDRLTSFGKIVGTPGFMAPEAMIGAQNDERSDIYAIGCLMYWLVVGDVVFRGKNLTEIAAKHYREEVVPPSMQMIDISDGFEAVILRCLEKNPDERFQSVDRLAAALKQCRPTEERWNHARASAWWRKRGPLRPRSIPLTNPPAISGSDRTEAA